MCGRFALQTNKKEIEQFFTVNINTPYNNSYNSSPGSFIYSIIQQNNSYRFTTMDWGFIPDWGDTSKFSVKPINARAETILDKPFFRKAVKHNRCIVIASGYFEWQKLHNHKQPYYIYLKHSRILPFAGIWSRITVPNSKEVNTCAILTSKATSDLKDIHHRKPVILQKHTYELWLNNNYQEILDDLELKSEPENNLSYYKVSNKVNNPYNNYPELLEQIPS